MHSHELLSDPRGHGADGAAAECCARDASPSAGLERGRLQCASACFDWRSRSRRFRSQVFRGPLSCGYV